MDTGGCEEELKDMQFRTASTIHERVRNLVAHPKTQLRRWT